MTRLFILISSMAIIQMASSASGPPTPSSSSSSDLFASDLFSQISKSKIKENVIISPISIQTALAMVFLGAEEETATELEKGLRLSSNSKENVGKTFAGILNAKSGEAQLNIANRIYIDSRNKLRPTFNELARKYFNSEAETVNFSKSSEAVQTINTWVEKETNNKITNLLEPESVDVDTSAIIVNAIYFKGNWQTPFSKDSTSKKPFWISQTKSVEADTMSLYSERFKYAELAELDVTAIELPYKDSNISMIIILPNEREGLARLEEKLSSIAINKLSSKLELLDVNVLLPKFKIEFEIGLKNTLEQLGIRSIFKDSANLSGIFETGPCVKVSDVQHKALIDVNEAGSEAAAASFIKLVPSSLNLNQKHFQADHPFVFAIINANTVYFVGHIATL